MRPDASQSEASSRFLTISNLLSISRALLAIPFVLIMLHGGPSSRLWGFLLLGVAALTDKLDGTLARKYKEVTEWGKILDPLADKIGVSAGALVLLLLGDLPLWFFIVVVARDLLIFAGGVYLKGKSGIVLPSNLAGKWAVGLISLVLCLGVLGVRSWPLDLLLVLSTIMLAISLGTYAVRFLQTVRSFSMVQHGHT